MINKTKVFKCGNSEAVRLPKGFGFDEKDVYIKKLGAGVIIYPEDGVWNAFFESLNGFTDDFLSERGQGTIENRENL